MSTCVIYISGYVNFILNESGYEKYQKGEKMKRNVVIYADSALVEMARLKKINLSRTFNDALRIRLDMELPSKDNELMKQKESIEGELIRLREMMENKQQVLNELKEQEEKRRKEDESKIIKRIIIE